MRTAIKEVKQKSCKACGDKFRPSLSTQKACSVKCALDLAKQPENQNVARKAIDQRDRREIKVRKEKLKSRAAHAKDTQQAFNEWVRLRDAALPCVSCGRHHDGQYHAGHYRTVAANPELRFEPLNVHKQCAPCNNHKSGDILNYRIELLKRIGAEAVEWLEGPHAPKKYTVEQLKAMTADYRAKTRELKRAAA
ncbi:recombination protein NinG [Pseudomonas koreensis]|uniref:recombination protein NinG n=1 Tax=Pseudomonas koreensis TaxID=198620 RepID=UPI001B343AD4|nr:recombination protein NinG [Pseudomonas koreensis]MBP3996744.1 recombination protein NinG [Pseudomonas koreensis]MBP3999943.1 recombination protein NinG [Pseudomonas koreensis]MBP4000655.1 recombination protein NinG [Pseudomonas koreensis]MBP4001534.1 recombination protein NinG [Pseudomonas koreensis]